MASNANENYSLTRLHRPVQVFFAMPSEGRAPAQRRFVYFGVVPHRSLLTGEGGMRLRAWVQGCVGFRRCELGRRNAMGSMAVFGGKLVEREEMVGGPLAVHMLLDAANGRGNKRAWDVRCVPVLRKCDIKPA